MAVSCSTEQGCFSPPPLPPWLGCRTHQPAADDGKESQKGRLWTPTLLGYQETKYTMKAEYGGKT